MCLGVFGLVSIARGREVRFVLFEMFLENDERLSNVVFTNCPILSRSNKASAFYSFFVRIILKVCLWMLNMHGSVAYAPYLLIQRIMRRTPPIPLSKFI
jgi:hypothetical protein